MTRIRTSFVALALSLACGGSTSEPQTPSCEGATVVVAGHAYGGGTDVWRRLAEQVLPGVDLLVLTGDLMQTSSADGWREIAATLAATGVPWEVALGNHDKHPYRLPLPAAAARTVAGRLVIVLDTSRPGWTIDTEQGRWLRATLGAHPDARELLVFTHQLWWAKPGPLDLPQVYPNSPFDRDGPSDFWSDAFPLFADDGRPVWFFAGDLGAWADSAGFWRHREGRFGFHASGMGAGDNGFNHQTVHLGADCIEVLDHRG